MLTIAVVGASGRMGRELIMACRRHDGARCGAALVRAGHTLCGTDVGVATGAGPTGTVFSDDVDAALAGCDVAIDFSRADVSAALLARYRAAGKPVVVGTTGFSPAQKDAFAAAAAELPLLLAPNTSVGVNLSLKLLEQAARAFGDDADIEIIETHHRNKVDAPSGTALQMGETIAAALGRDLSSCAVYGREGHAGPRDRQTIGFATVRAGDVVGEHTVLFAGDGERLEITHRASSRATFAAGAVRAAIWLAGRPAGIYTMRDVLGLDGATA